jgi:CheY-like chemotaxis protein
MPEAKEGVVVEPARINRRRCDLTDVRLISGSENLDRLRCETVAQAAKPNPGKAILVAEDEEDLRLVVSEALTIAGFTVVNAETGPEALRILEANPGIDLLFTDIMMPGGMDGFELAHRAKQLRPDLRVVYTSGFVKELPWGNHGVGYGPMLPKPCRHRDLVAEVTRTLAAQG